MRPPGRFAQLPAAPVVVAMLGPAPHISPGAILTPFWLFASKMASELVPVLSRSVSTPGALAGVSSLVHGRPSGPYCPADVSCFSRSDWLTVTSPAPSVPLCTTSSGLLQTPGWGELALQSAQVLPGQSGSPLHAIPTFAPPWQTVAPSRQARLSEPSGCSAVSSQVGSSGNPLAEPLLFAWPGVVLWSRRRVVSRSAAPPSQSIIPVPSAAASIHIVAMPGTTAG